MRSSSDQVSRTDVPASSRASCSSVHSPMRPSLHDRVHGGIKLSAPVTQRHQSLAPRPIEAAYSICEVTVSFVVWVPQVGSVTAELKQGRR
jgi:hypothetical protein